MKNNKNIIFIGFMGSGKTTFGKKVSKRLEMDFVDTDKYMECLEGMSVSNIFQLKGEGYFRQKETEICEKFSSETGHVIATGGGMIKNDENMRFLKKNGVVVYLKASPEHIFKNIGNDTSRPLLQCDDKLGKIKSLMEERKSLYEKYADITINVTGGTVSGITRRIIEALEAEK